MPRVSLKTMMEKRQAKINAEARRAATRATNKKVCMSTIAAATKLDDSDPGNLTEFLPFPKLPLELRVKVWRHALWAPQIIAYSRCNRPGRPADSDFEVPLPPILLVNLESKAETLRVYDAYHASLPKPSPDRVPRTKWLRLEIDILHFKPMDDDFVCWNFVDMSKSFARPGQLNKYISQWHEEHGKNTTTIYRSDKWRGRPDSFSKIKHIAISRDLLWSLPDDYEPFIRHFLPALETLIILIDEDTDLEGKWDLCRADFRVYEKLPKEKHLRVTLENPEGLPRFDFAKQTVGPFKQIKVNDEYQMEIEYEMRKHFSREEQLNNWYTAPVIQVLGASIPHDVEFSSYGRLPYVKKKIDTSAADPFI